MGRCKNSLAMSSSDVGRDDRAGRLLKICSELEQYEAQIAPDDFRDWIESAVIACGFISVYEACECLLGPELFQLHLKTMHAIAAQTARAEHVNENLYESVFETPRRRQRTRYC
jgi:hypothetical protein